MTQLANPMSPSLPLDGPLRVLVVDDTVTYRQLVSRLLGDLAGVEVVGAAANGRIALQKIEQTNPDLLLLDLEMPEMDGLEVLRRLRAASSDIGAIMLSGFTEAGANATLEALKLGAFDFVLKPRGDSFEGNTRQLRDELRPKLEAFARTRTIQRLLGKASSKRPAEAAVQAPSLFGAPLPLRVPRGKVEAVAIGISTGGPQALTVLLPALPANLAAPVLIVQHMPPSFTRSLAEDLDRRCRLSVREGADGDVVSAGTVYIAPGGRQMKVVEQGGAVVVRITDDPPENSCRPSADYLFRSVAGLFGPRAAGVIMTGMGNDGAEGCRIMKRAGAPIVAQDQATCVVFGMPREPVEQGIADVVAPLDRIAHEIVRLAGKD